jgi:vitamin-K-epoxide reductase (warfarin-sensitive)
MQPAVSEDSAASSRNGSSRLLLCMIAALAIAGIIVSAIALQRHYAKSATEFCEFSQRFNCDIVNRSEYSSIVGIPVAGIGIVGYGVILLLATWWRARVETPTRLLVAALAGLAFALYLTYIEAYVLETWCILCVISLCAIFLISLCSLVVKLRSTRA